MEKLIGKFIKDSACFKHSNEPHVIAICVNGKISGILEKSGTNLPLTKDGICYIYEPFINDDTLLMIFNDHHIEKINIIYDEV